MKIARSGTKWLLWVEHSDYEKIKDSRRVGDFTRAVRRVPVCSTMEKMEGHARTIRADFFHEVPVTEPKPKPKKRKARKMTKPRAN